MEDKKYYWLKLKKDFFKRHDITIIENMPNGKDYLLFYMKLLLESIDHNGELRFSNEIPYNEIMLSSITNTNVDVVKSAISVFTQLKMMEILDDGTIYMRETQKMIGNETFWAETKRKQRLKVDNVQQLSTSSPNCPSKSIDIELDKDIKNKNNNKDIVGKTFVKPTIDEIKSYCLERKNNVDPDEFYDFYESKGWLIGKNKMKDWRASVRTWERNNKNKPMSKSNQFIEHIPDYSSTKSNMSDDELDALKKRLSNLKK